MRYLLKLHAIIFLALTGCINHLPTQQEEWLTKAASRLQIKIEEVQNKPLPRYKVYVRKLHGNTIGFYYPGLNGNEVWISSYLEDSQKVLSTLLHELVHVSTGAFHGKEFTQLATQLGLKGKMFQSESDAECEAYLQKVINQIGTYPAN